MTDDKKETGKPDVIGEKPVDKCKLAEDNKGECSFTVNGVTIKTPHHKLVAQDILKLARDKGAIPEKPGDYILQGKKDNRQYKLDDWVDMDEDNECITIPDQSTPVA